MNYRLCKTPFANLSLTSFAKKMQTAARAMNVWILKKRISQRKMVHSKGLEPSLTIARVTNKGSISVIGGFGQKATCKTCKRYEEETGVNGITAHPIFSLPPLEFVKEAKSVTNPTS